MSSGLPHSHTHTVLICQAAADLSEKAPDLTTLHYTVVSLGINWSSHLINSNNNFNVHIYPLTCTNIILIFPLLVLKCFTFSEMSLLHMWATKIQCFSLELPKLHHMIKSCPKQTMDQRDGLSSIFIQSGRKGNPSPTPISRKNGVCSK